MSGCCGDRQPPQLSKISKGLRGLAPRLSLFASTALGRQSLPRRRSEYSMSWRYAYGLLATLILSTVLQATEVIVSGEIIHTLRYVTGPGPGFEVQDTLDNDSVWIIWGDESLSWNVGQVQLVLFHLPTPLAVCDCLYITVTATNLSFETFHGRTGIAMNIFSTRFYRHYSFSVHAMGIVGFLLHIRFSGVRPNLCPPHLRRSRHVFRLHFRPRLSCLS